MFSHRALWLYPVLSIVFVVQSYAAEPVDLEVVHQIKNAAFQGSEVMDLMFELTDVNGPRLTNSPGYNSAAHWARGKFDEWGLHDAKLESWGEFGRGWSYDRLHIDMLEPVAMTLTGIPLAWCSGTLGAVQGEVVAAPLFPRRNDPDRFDLEKLAARIEKYRQEYRGQLAGKIVLMDAPREFELASKAASSRLDGDELSKLQTAPDPQDTPEIEIPIMKMPADRKERRAMFATVNREVLRDFFKRRSEVRRSVYEFYVEEGVTAVLRVDSRGDGSIIFAEGTGAHKADAINPPPTIVLAPEQYNRLDRLIEKDIGVLLSVDLSAQFHADELEGHNVIAEIPGGSKRDEVVMVGAHLDSWHAGTGATDNAAGSVVMMEAMRILKDLDLKMDRTVRIALWSGEEQGLLGSHGYVKQHFGDPVTMALKPQHEKLSVYLNVDNGGGKIRGVYLQGNDMARAIFQSWLAPFKDHGVKTLTIRNTGGTDHLSFDAVGLPGFQFIQDPLDYFSRTHHSDLDVFDHIVPSDLMQAAAVVASSVYHAANRDELFPRKPLPKALPSSDIATRD